MRLIPFVLRFLVLALCICGPAFAQSPAVPDATQAYQVSIGDVLQLRIVSVPALDRKLTVQSDGTITLPLLGRQQVAGQTIEAIEAQIKTEIPNVVYRGQDAGREQLIIIRPEEVSLEISAFMPVYVDGVVDAPGKIDFQIGMTVRKAIAAAGGMRRQPVLSGNDTDLDLTDIRGRIEAKYIDLASLMSEVAQTEAFLNDATTIDSTGIEALPLDADVTKTFVATANARLAAYQKQVGIELDYLGRASKQTENRVFSTLRREENAMAEMDLERQETQRIEDLYSRNLISAARLTEARRTMLSVGTRAFDAADRVATAQNEQTDKARQLDLTKQEKRVDAYVRLDALQAKVQVARAEVLALEDKRGVLESRQSGLYGSDQPEISVTLFRPTEDAKGRTVSLDELVAPGDLIAIAR